jgi:hypothetical protein
MENDSLAHETVQLDDLWKLETSRHKLEKEKLHAYELEINNLKSLLRKISYFEDL